MKSAAFIAGIFLYAGAGGPAALALERVTDQSYPAPPGCALRLDTYHGAVELKAATDGRIRIEVHVDAPVADDAVATQLLNRLQLAVGQTGNTVSVLARNPAETRLSFTWQDAGRLHLSYVVSVPPGCDVALVTGQGDLAVGDLVAHLHLHTRSGQIVCKRVGGDLTAESDTGDIVLSHSDGPATLTTRRGDIRAGAIMGRAVVRSRNGDASVQQAEGGIDGYVEAGSLTVGFTAALAGPGHLVTDGGDLTVTLPADARCAVEASAVWGRVHSALPFILERGGDGQKQLAGRLNGGGPLLQLHANGGQVRIQLPRI